MRTSVLLSPSRTLRNMARLWEIATVMARYDALFPLEHVPVARLLVPLARLLIRRSKRLGEGLRPGQRLALAFVALGPPFIKLGQALSTRSDLTGEQIANDLSELQDRLPPFPFAQVKVILESDLERPLGEVFASFDEVPVAAASIAQVHYAVTSDGAEVAVKVLRPGVEAAFRRDVDLLRWLAQLVETAQPQFRRLHPVDSVEAFADTVDMEMDLRFEAAAAAELANNFKGDTTFRVPTIDWTRTARRLMTQQRIIGTPVDERATLLAAGHDPVRIIENAADAFFNMVFRDGFFHADLHPGNLFIDQTGMLVAVDFGIMGRVDQTTRRYLGEMLLGFVTGNYRRVAEIHFEAGWVPADKSVDAFTQACRSIAEPILGKPIQEISIAGLLGQLFAITEQFSMEAQPQLLLLQKSMLLAEGIGRTLAPDINMWELSAPLIEDWMLSTFGPRARLQRGAEDIVKLGAEFPTFLSHAARAAETLAQGAIRLHPDSLKALAEATRRPLLPSLLPWVLVAILAMALVFKR